MNPKTLEAYRILTQKHDGMTARDLMLAMMMSKLDIIEGLLALKASETGGETLKEIAEKNDADFVRQCDIYLEMIHQDPSSGGGTH
jgi:hypothetical protein